MPALRAGHVCAIISPATTRCGVLQRAAPQSRAHLAFLLWPDSAEAQARTNLRTLLHRLRQALPDADHFLDVAAQTVRWRADAPWTWPPSSALARADQAQQRGDLATMRAALQEAIEHYCGDLLPAWYDDWVLSDSTRSSSWRWPRPPRRSCGARGGLAGPAGAGARQPARGAPVDAEQPRGPGSA